MTMRKMRMRRMMGWCSRCKIRMSKRWLRDSRSRMRKLNKKWKIRDWLIPIWLTRTGFKTSFWTTMTPTSHTDYKKRSFQSWTAEQLCRSKTVCWAFSISKNFRSFRFSSKTERLYTIVFDTIRPKTKDKSSKFWNKWGRTIYLLVKEWRKMRLMFPSLTENPIRSFLTSSNSLLVLQRMMR